MTKKKIYVSLLLSILLVTMPAKSSTSIKPVADIVLGPNSLCFQPTIQHAGITVRIKGPGDVLFERQFKTGTVPYIEWNQPLPDGSYTYELCATPSIKHSPRDGQSDQTSTSKSPSLDSTTQSGYFRVLDGIIVTTTGGMEDGNTLADIVQLDDVIIDGSLCVGNDCVTGEDFGYDTIMLKENNLRIYFNDTSSIAGYATNSWRIEINGHLSGGGEYFAIQDADSAANIFVAEAGAPANSLYVDDNGDIGIGTATPVYELHIADGDSPAIRLEQDTSYGWPSQRWDLVGNETNFFIRDATHASRLPFRIEPDTPTNTLGLAASGFVGIGTFYPESKLELEGTSEDVQLLLDRTDGAEAQITAKSNVVNIGSRSNHQVRFFVNQITRMSLLTDNSMTMASGAECTVAGVWQNASSIELKENIQPIGESEAIEALEKLNPVKYNYKVDKEEQCLGFIAEEAPELVATKSRKTMSPMDVVALLTKVVQNQRETMQRQQKAIDELTQKIERLDRKIK